MSVQTEIDRISTEVQNAHLKVIEKGGTSAAPYLVANLAKAIDTIPEAGGGLLDGVSALASGTYTPTADASYRANVEHGLGVNPNFCIVMMEENLSDTTLTSALVGASVFYKKSKISDSGATLYSVHMMMEGYNASNQFNGTATRLDSTAYFKTDTFAIPCNSTYKLKSGYTYRWVCGVLDGIN